MGVVPKLCLWEPRSWAPLTRLWVALHEAWQEPALRAMGLEVWGPHIRQA